MHPARHPHVHNTRMLLRLQSACWTHVSRSPRLLRRLRTQNKTKDERRQCRRQENGTKPGPFTPPQVSTRNPIHPFHVHATTNPQQSSKHKKTKAKLQGYYNNTQPLVNFLPTEERPVSQCKSNPCPPHPPCPAVLLGPSSFVCSLMLLPPGNYINLLLLERPGSAFADIVTVRQVGTGFAD